MEPADEIRVFEELGTLENEFAQIELAALRQKELGLRPLYSKRQTLLNRIPDFWTTVLDNSPDDIAETFTQADLAILASLKSLFVERHEITSATEGDPRSLRFTFEFEKNDFFEGTKLVKEVLYRSDKPPSQNPVSVPVPIKWKSKKVDPTQGALDLAVDLYKAEETFRTSSQKTDVELDQDERESLWQYEKLREKLDELDGERPSFFNWFGYRGAVAGHAGAAETKGNGVNGQNGEAEADHEGEDEEEQDTTLDVELCPGGDELAIALAEDLWPNVMDFYMAAQESSEDEMDEDGSMNGGFDGFDEEAEDEEEIPDLVPREDEGRPKKRPRTE